MLYDARDQVQESAKKPHRALDRDDRRIEQVVREHFTGVWRLVRRYGLTAADADDVTQRTMMIAAQHIDEIILGRERPYLYRTALFLTSKVHRDRRRHPQQSLDDYDEPGESQSSPEALLEQRRARAQLDAILSQIPEDFRVVFVLYELESLSQWEIASTLGIPQGTVSSRLRRARESFADLMRRSSRSPIQSSKGAIP